MKINFIYEVKDNKYIIGNMENNSLKGKKYYFGNLSNLDIEDNIVLYLKDNKFDFQSKNFSYNDKKKINIKEIDRNLSKFDFGKNIFVGYCINNILDEGNKSDFLLGKSGKIDYDLCIYTLKQKYYNEVLKEFGKNIDIKMYPNSFWLVRKVGENLQNGSIMYILNNEIKIINIKKGFYENIEQIDIGIKQFKNNIKSIFGKELKNLRDLPDFNKKVYKKELERFLEPINIFIKNVTKNNSNKIFVIGNFENTPELLTNISEGTKKTIVPIQMGSKKFKTIEEADIFCINNI